MKDYLNGWQEESKVLIPPIPKGEEEAGEQEQDEEDDEGSLAREVAGAVPEHEVIAEERLS